MSEKVSIERLERECTEMEKVFLRNKPMSDFDYAFCRGYSHALSKIISTAKKEAEK